MRAFWIGSALVLLGPAGALAQSVAELVRLGQAVAPAHPNTAYRYFVSALRIDSLDYEANWRAAVSAVEWGQETPDSVESPARDSLYADAARYAHRAVAVDSTRADGWFALAMALGRAALGKSRGERIRDAKEIYDAANRTLALAPDHDGAHHVLGLWNAEVMRLSGLARFMAKNLLGGKVLGKASWENAIAHLERAVELDPGRIYHRLDLARVYADRKRWEEARTQLDAIASLPDRVARDPSYREAALALGARLDGEKDGA